MKIRSVVVILFLLVSALAFSPVCEAKNELKVGEMWNIRGVDPVKKGTLVKEKALITENLVEADPDFSLRPGLAKSWKQLSPTHWRFYLRKGVKFHDGSEMKAGDVKWAIERALKDPSIKSLTKIKEIKVIDDYTIDFITEGPYAAFPATLHYSKVSIVSPHSEMDKNGVITKPIGTGPFMLVKWDPATETLYLKGFKDYWQGKPKLDELIIKAIPDPASREVAVEKGEIDFTCDVPYGDVERLSREKGIKLEIHPTARVYQLTFGSLHGTPYEDVRVRKAISYAIDKKSIAQIVLHGCAEPAKGIILPSLWWANNNVSGYDYNPKKAKELLKEAGWVDTDNDGILEKNGKEFHVTIYTYPQRPGLKPMAETIQAFLKNVGIKAEVRVLDWSAIGKYMKKYDMKLSAYHLAMVPDPDYYLRKIYHSKGSTNTWGYNNPEMDKLLEKGLTTFDQQERKKIYDKVQELALKDLPLIHIAFYKVLVVYRDYVKGFKFNPVAHDYMLNPEIYVAK
ncbi:ABC transporter substrate-binding protein [Thermodesulfatator indicus]